MDQQKETRGDLAAKSVKAGFSWARRLWNNLTRPARVGVIVTLAAAAVVIVALAVTNLAAPPMEVLFSGLNPEQAQAIVSGLEESKVPYRVGDDAATILVPRDQKNRLRLKYSSEINARGAGFALFETNNFITSDFERRTKWQIALEEELCRTITSIETVDNARVHLVMPERSVFFREKNEPTAAVFLKMKPLAELSAGQVQGILNLVAGSVEGLSPENITLIDSLGNSLYDPYLDAQSAAGGVTSAERQLALTRQFEREVEVRLRQVLDRIYGPGRAAAMVSAELDFDTVERTTVTYDSPLTRSQQRVEERSQGLGPAAAEVGESNIPGYTAISAGSGGQGYERLEETINYEIGETREFMSRASGQLSRLSVAVMLDESVAGPDTVERISSVLRPALGITPGRGDTFSVQLIPFDDSWRQEQTLPKGTSPAWPRLLSQPGLLMAMAGGLALTLILIAALGAIRRASEPATVMKTAQQALAEAMEERIPKDIDQSKREKARQLAEEEPENMALLLKTWLAGE